MTTKLGWGIDMDDGFSSRLLSNSYFDDKEG